MMLLFRGVTGLFLCTTQRDLVASRQLPCGIICQQQMKFSPPD